LGKKLRTTILVVVNELREKIIYNNQYKQNFNTLTYEENNYNKNIICFYFVKLYLINKSVL